MYRFNKKLLQLTVFFLLFFSSTVQGKEISVAISLDRAAITVGDPVHYKLTIRYDPSLKINPLKLGENLKAFEILNYQNMPVRKEEGIRIEETRYLLTVFEVGSYEIPSLEIRYTDSHGESKSVHTPSLSLKVHTVNTEDIQDIRDIKEPLEITWNWRPSARAVLFVAVLLGVGWGIYRLIRYWRQSRLGKMPDLPENILSPEEEALAALKELRKEGWIEAGKAKEFYTRISDILRYYIGRRYQFGATEQTSQALEKQLRYKGIGEKPFEQVIDILTESDLAKFARYIPSSKIMEGVFPQMEDIIETTRPPMISGD